MADSPAKPKRRIRKVETVREQAEKQRQEKTKRRRVRQAASVAAWPFKWLRFLNNRVTRILIPRYIRNSFKELRVVVWPNRKETTQLTIAVFAFAIIFGVLITITDYGLDKIFKKILLK